MKWLIRFTLTIFTLHLLIILLTSYVSPYLAGGGILAYTRIDSDYNPHILVIDVRSGLSLEVTPENFEGRTPQWTYDGRRLTFATIHNRAMRHVLEINFDTHATRNLTTIWGFESVPIYSPIDSRIAFPARANITLMPLLMVDEAQPEIEPQEILPRIRRDVAWSPDGQYLAYITVPQQTDNELSAGNVNLAVPNLFTLHLETGEIINRSEGLPNLTSPVWSPDSTKLAITTTVTTAGNLQIIDIVTGEITPMLTASSGVQSPTWSPDGQRIAYMAREDGDFEIFVMDLATGEARNLSHSPSFDIRPTWSADGKRIAYISHRNGQNDIYVVHIESGRTYRLTFTEDSEDEVTWQPR